MALRDQIDKDFCFDRIRKIQQEYRKILIGIDETGDELIRDLLATCADSSGLGIAAPQVGESLRVVIIASAPCLPYPQAPRMEPTPMINARIVERSEKKRPGWEGCLSIPGLRGLVPRHTWVKVDFIDRTGKLRKMRLAGFPAVIMQHELDHLNGIVFTDRVNPTTLVTEKEYHRILAKKKK